MMSDHDEEVEASALHVAPPNKENKQLIVQQLLKEIKEATVKAKRSYGIMG